jgi:hypothetical protein
VKKACLKSVYIFNHIPKCAGVSYQAMLSTIFTADEVTHISLNLDTDYHIDPEDYRKYRVVMGHFGVRWNPILGPGRRWLTALRDPIDRVVSTYFFWRNNAPLNSEVPYLHLAQTLSLDEFIQSDHYLVRQGIRNAQTWQLADDFRVRYRSIAEQDALEVAKASLSKFDFIGLYESFSQSAARLCDYLGVPTPAQLPHENGTLNRKTVNELSPATIQMIEELNGADMALYEYANMLINGSRQGPLNSFGNASQA